MILNQQLNVCSCHVNLWDDPIIMLPASPSPANPVGHRRVADVAAHDLKFFWPVPTDEHVVTGTELGPSHNRTCKVHLSVRYGTGSVNARWRFAQKLILWSICADYARFVLNHFVQRNVSLPHCGTNFIYVFI